MHIFYQISQPENLCRGHSDVYRIALNGFIIGINRINDYFWFAIWAKHQGQVFTKNNCKIINNKIITDENYESDFITNKFKNIQTKEDLEQFCNIFNKLEVFK